MNPARPPRPRLVFPFTVLSGPDTVRLVAGEDFRYTFSGPGLECWLPGLLASLDGRRTTRELLGLLGPEFRDAAAGVIDRLYGERVVCDGPAEAAHVANRFRPVPEGTGPLVERLRHEEEGADEAVDRRPLPVLCQDRLDYYAALEFNRRRLEGDVPWLWVTHGPLSRGYVSPLFLPEAGPCLACLLRQFQRLSPAGEIYDDLIAHARAGRDITPVPFPEAALEILRQITCWKLSLASRSDPPVGLYRLHVVEADSLEVSTHRVFARPDCPQCPSLR
jgi:bacteriocin biosynthesis cyclodehydratase domain-containing protein